MKKYLIIGLGVMAGAVGGYLYWSYIGCTTGTCPITSVWYRSTLYGAFLGGTLGFSFFNKSKKEKDMATYNNISGEAFTEAIQKDKQAQVLDVRTPAEYKSGHVPGALNIDYFSSDRLEQLKKLDKDKPYYIYCRSGNRSASAASEMTSAGFEKVFNLSGGVGSLRNIKLERTEQ